ncbi:hypothetical protein DER29_4366 [Micromonospora sp. M71_S20]|nr:hypothetical protein [Micromonospora sp. M71_S20]RLK13347.1 hypothetical protein DER29_4366 [Micromonospora sp. M71_S20]
MTAPAASWQRDLVEHRQINGRCRLCGTRRRCWPWAAAFAARLVDQMRRP